MAAKGGRKAKPKKVNLKGCVTFKGGRLKKCFPSEKAGNDYLKRIQQFDTKQAYTCSICGQIHVGRRLGGKQNGRTSQALQNA